MTPPKKPGSKHKHTYTHARARKKIRHTCRIHSTIMELDEAKRKTNGLKL